METWGLIRSRYQSQAIGGAARWIAASPAAPRNDGLWSALLKLWRLTRAPYVALDGAGPELHGARYSSPGRPVVNFASEAGLAVLVALRYLPADMNQAAQDYVLGWTEVDAVPEQISGSLSDEETKIRVDSWLCKSRSLLLAVRSKVLPEADIVMLNPLHPGAAKVAPLTTRPFDFAHCLHHPPMLDRYGTDI